MMALNVCTASAAAPQEDANCLDFLFKKQKTPKTTYAGTRKTLCGFFSDEPRLGNIHGAEDATIGPVSYTHLAPSRCWVWGFLHFRNVYISGKV